MRVCGQVAIATKTVDPEESPYPVANTAHCIDWRTRPAPKFQQTEVLTLRGCRALRTSEEGLAVRLTLAKDSCGSTKRKAARGLLRERLSVNCWDWPVD